MLVVVLVLHSVKLFALSALVSVCCGGLAVILLLLVLGHSYWYLVAFFRVLGVGN